MFTIFDYLSAFEYSIIRRYINIVYYYYSKEITELFSEKYKHLYNSVPYNTDDMHAIESTIFERLHNCENVKYVISHSDVINSVSHLKNDK